MKVAIIPALNEEDTIGSVVLGTKKHVDKVIVIDDGCRDKTAEIARLAGAEVAQHSKNEGKGIALKTGFEVAKKFNAHAVVCIDADGQHNPDDIPEVIAPILSGEAEMVIGSRYINKEHKKDIPKYRRLGLWILTKTINLGSEVKTTDSQCGFRAFSGDVLDKFIFNQKGLSVESEMLEDAIDNDIKIKEVPISARYEGLDTSTEKPGKHGFGVLNFILSAVKERHPLLFFGVTGAILLILGLALAIYCLECFYTQGFIPFGPALTASVLILLGTLGVFAGLILNSISGMFQGLARLSRHNGYAQTENIDERTRQKYTLLGPFLHEPLSKDIITNNTPVVTALDYNQLNLLRDIEGQKTLGLSLINYNHNMRTVELINGNGIHGLPIMNHNHKDSILEETNDHEILGPTPINYNLRETILEEGNYEEIEEVPGLDNHREEMLLKNIDDEKIHM
jgi:glycosyltransferase involved in cell wall biosynthesis